MSKSKLASTLSVEFMQNVQYHFLFSPICAGPPTFRTILIWYFEPPVNRQPGFRENNSKILTDFFASADFRINFQNRKPRAFFFSSNLDFHLYHVPEATQVLHHQNKNYQAPSRSNASRLCNIPASYHRFALTPLLSRSYCFRTLGPR